MIRAIAAPVAAGVGEDVVVAGALAFFAVAYGRDVYTRAAATYRRRRRVRRIDLAAAEAVEDDPDFAPDHVRESARQLIHDVYEAWDRRDLTRLELLMGSDLLVEWKRRLDALDRKGWHNRVYVPQWVGIEYVGLVNRGADRDDRVVVRVEAQLRDKVFDRDGKRVSRRVSPDNEILSEYWTLGKRGDGGWMVLSIERGAEGEHNVRSKIVASPWADERLRDEALVEGAVANQALTGYAISELTDLDLSDDARAVALDLSVADGRFAPAVLEAAVRAAVAAWAEAIDGDDAALLALATPGAVHVMLHPRGMAERRRLVVRGPRVRAMRVTALDAAAEPPAMEVEVDLRGRRYLQHRSTGAVLAGVPESDVNFTERWVMSLSGDDKHPWRIVDVTPAPV